VKKLLLFVFLCFFTNIFSQDNLYGIKFRSGDKGQLVRSSVRLNNGNPLKLKDHFSVSFDISFWSLRYFGPVFRATLNNKEFARLVFNQFQDNDYYLLQLFLDELKDPLLIKLDKNSFTVNKWINIKIEFNSKADSVSLYLDKHLKEKTAFAIADELELSMFFGIIDHKNPMDYDIPAIYLKNILIEEKGQKKYFWLLNPYDESFDIDKINNKKISLINTDWLVKDHYRWYKKYEVTVTNYPLFAHDSINSRIFIDDKHRLIKIDLIRSKDSVINYRNYRPGKWHDLLYDNFRNRLYSVFNAQGEVSVYDFLSNQWTSIDTSKEVDGHYYGSVKFISPLDSLIYLYGGYGWYTAKEKLFQYDFNNTVWKEVKLPHNIGYRFNVSISPGFDNKHYLFWSGFGNYSGKQEEGFFHFNDLHSFDLIKKEFSKIWDFKNIDELKKYSHLFENFYLNKTDSTFYFMRNYEDSNKTFFQLFKADLKTSQISKVGDALSFNLPKTKRNVYFCYDSNTEEFLFVKQNEDSTKVILYGLKYPPVPEQTFASISNFNVEPDNNHFIILILAGSLLMIFFLYLYFRNKKTKPSHIENTDTPTFEPQAYKNYIQTFGGLKIFNRDGQDVFNEFTPKLKEVFTLILVRSLNNHSKGITSEELSSVIWPDFSPESAKSNRGVAINKIRKILSSVDGLEIDFSNKLWSLKLSGDAKCDFQEYTKWKYQLRNSDDPENLYLTQLLNLIKDGGFLEDLSYEWLESFKLAINNEVISLLKELLDKLTRQGENNIGLRIKICDTILKFDSVDEEAFKTKIRLHYESGNHQLAKNSYKLFVAEYKRLYDETYPLSFQDVLFSK